MCYVATCLLITRGIFPCEKNKIELLECSGATDWLLEIDPTYLPTLLLGVTDCFDELLSSLSDQIRSNFF